MIISFLFTLFPTKRAAILLVKPFINALFVECFVFTVHSVTRVLVSWKVLATDDAFFLFRSWVCAWNSLFGLFNFFTYKGRNEVGKVRLITVLFIVSWSLSKVSASSTISRVLASSSISKSLLLEGSSLVLNLVLRLNQILRLKLLNFFNMTKHTFIISWLIHCRSLFVISKVKSLKELLLFLFVRISPLLLLLIFRFLNVFYKIN